MPTQPIILDGCIVLGAPRCVNSTENRYPLHSRRAGIWHNFATARRVFQLLTEPGNHRSSQLCFYTVQRLQAPPVRNGPQRKVHISKVLASCTHAFIWRDSVQKPLQPPYDGPYKATHRRDKHFTLDIHGKTDTVSIDHLKPAHSDSTIDLTIPYQHLHLHP